MIDAVLPLLPRQLRAVVQLQLLTAARGGEVLSMRRREFDTGSRQSIRMIRTRQIRMEMRYRLIPR